VANSTISTISTIWKYRDKIQSVFENSSTSVKKYPIIVDKALFEWLKIHRSNNIPISGPIPQAKANGFARQLELQDFKCSVRSIQRFRKRLILFLWGNETADVMEGVCNHWLTTVWPNLRKGYKDEEIFNTDETALKLFFLPPNTTSVLQPMDQGVTHSLKTHFRKLQMKKLLKDVEEKGVPQKLDILETISQSNL
ncbi:hypothetical protein NQ318_012438, partial [Aromia moschata]